MRWWCAKQVIKAGHLISALGCVLAGGHTLDKPAPDYCRFCGRLQWGEKA